MTDVDPAGAVLGSQHHSGHLGGTSAMAGERLARLALEAIAQEAQAALVAAEAERDELREVVNSLRRSLVAEDEKLARRKVAASASSRTRIAELLALLPPAP